jgi:transcriptional regulator with XRE-family HTH domain
VYFETINKLADARGISIKALEEKAGLGNGTIGKWKTMKPNLGSLDKVAKCLGVSVAYIVRLSEREDKSEGD